MSELKQLWELTLHRKTLYLNKEPTTDYICLNSDSILT